MQNRTYMRYCFPQTGHSAVCSAHMKVIEGTRVLVWVGGVVEAMIEKLFPW